jgi:hypothetical protein
MMNIKLPSTKMKNITTAYPSCDQIMKGFGAGSGLGGTGQEAWQSTHEHAGVLPYE